MAGRKMINDMERINKILRKCDGPFTAEKRSFSYINRIFPNLGPDAEAVLICHVPRQTPTTVKDESKVEESAMEVTGSPLEHSFGDDSFNVTITPVKRNWLKYEERHYPLPRRIAAELVGLVGEEVDFVDDWTLPVFGLCDEKERDDGRQVVLIGTHHDSTWWTPLRVMLGGMETLTWMQKGCSMLPSEHMQETDFNTMDSIKVTIAGTYELCGTSHEMIDWKEQPKSEFKGYLKIEATWDTLTFLPPARTLSNSLAAKIVSGSKESSLCNLWDQILLLNKYLTILEEYNRRDGSSRYSVMPLIFPKNFSTPYLQHEDSVTSKLNRLLSGDDHFDDDDNTEALPVRDVNEYEKLIDIVKELPKRENRDFTDRLWQIIRGTDNYVQMTDCIYTVFEGIAENNYKPQLNDMDETRLAKIVSEMKSEHPKVSLRAGSLSLELMIDMGMEKISRDYIYLLSSMNLMEAYDLRKILIDVSTGDFSINKYRDKLMALTQIHISLEFLQLIQNHFVCRYDISYSIFESALKIYRGDKSPLKFEDLTENTIYTLTVPAPKEFLTEVTKMAPSSWMCTVHSERRDDKLTTITHYSRVPIFPPNIYTPPVPKLLQSTTEELYHTTKATITHMRYC